MGCIAGKDLAVNAADHPQNAKGDAKGNNALGVRQQPTNETYWAAGFIDAANVAPHFTPIKGPQSLFEKVPMPQQNVRKRILFAAPDDATLLNFLPSDGASLISDASTKRQLLLSLDVVPLTARRRGLDGAPHADFYHSLYSGVPRVLHQDAKLLNPNVLEDVLSGKFSLNEQGVPLAVPVPQSGTFRSQFYLPDEAIVGRAFLPNSLCNYAVGWIKVPTGPVVYRTTRDSFQPPPEAVIGFVDGLENPQQPPLVFVSSTEPPPEPRGYLSSAKPSYDVAFDGPVASPFRPQDPSLVQRAKKAGVNAAPEEAPPPRYLEKYFLYVKRVVSVGFTLAWKNATDKDAPFEDYCPRSVAAFASAASVTRSAISSSVIPGAFFTFVVPNPDSLETFSSHRGEFFASMFQAPFTFTENSIPLILSSRLHLQYEFWRHLQFVATNKTVALSPEERLGISNAVSDLTLDEKLWLAFQLHFKKFVLFASQQTISRKPAASNSCGSKAGSVQLACNLGIRVGYDNQHFIAYNSFGRNNHVVATASLGASNEGGSQTSLMENTTRKHFQSFLQFSDTTRSPAVDFSKPVAESSLVLSCRTSSDVVCAGVLSAHESESSVGGGFSRTTQSVFEPEIATLEFLFTHFIKDVKVVEQ